MKKQCLFIGPSAALIGAMALPALGQEPVTEAHAVEAITAKEDASIAEGTPGLEDAQHHDRILVTVQKREQDLQDVPAAVTHLSGDDFSVLNISNPFDFSEKVPGLVATNVQGYRRTFAIRGIGNELPDNAATKPGVAYHIDGVFMSNDFALFQDLVDVDRVEVLRGPDGTTFGNSSSGGAVNVITLRPDAGSAFGHFDAEVGSYSTLSPPYSPPHLLRHRHAPRLLRFARSRILTVRVSTIPVRSVVKRSSHGTWRHLVTEGW